MGHLHAQARKGEILQSHIARGGINDEFRQHRIECERLNAQSMPRQHDEIIFGMMRHLADLRIRQWRAQGFDHLLERQVCPARMRRWECKIPAPP